MYLQNPIMQYNCNTIQVSAAQATKVVSTLPPPVPAVPEERFPSVPEQSDDDAEEVPDEVIEKPQEPLEINSEENGGSLNQNSFTFQDQRPNFNFPQSPRALNPTQFGGLGAGANNFLFNRGAGSGGFNLPQSGRNSNPFNQLPGNPSFGRGLTGLSSQGQGFQGFPRNQQSFNNPQNSGGFNSFSQPGFQGSLNPTQSNFGNNGFGLSFGTAQLFGRQKPQATGGFGSEVGGQLQPQGNPNLEVETFKPGSVSAFLLISLL